MKSLGCLKPMEYVKGRFPRRMILSFLEYRYDLMSNSGETRTSLQEQIYLQREALNDLELALAYNLFLKPSPIREIDVPVVETFRKE